MANLRNEIDLYLQNLLALQFTASKNISHALTKGELREDFVKQVVLSQYPKLLLASGILIDGEWQSTQGDFIWLKENARMGNFNFYELGDCNLFMEIKSAATHGELVHLNDIAEEIHTRAKAIDENSRIIVGMFCYTTEATDKTILKKFGFKYDNELEGYSAYDPSKDVFKNIDFIISLNISEDGTPTPYMVIRDIYGACVLYNNNPVINNLFNYFK